MLPFDNTGFRELEGTYVAWPPRAPKAPSLVAFNDALAIELGLDAPALRAEATRWLSGSEVPDGAQPLAQAYAGHQFGNLSPQLGDGRALLLGELVTPDGRRFDLQLKGSGRTPFSRGGDGLAALGPMLREHLMGEAMHALGIPTTRSLAVLRTGETVYRETPRPGAVLARIAASHLRVGTLEFFAIRDDAETLARLVDHALARHHPDATGDTPALALFTAVRDAQARRVAQWMGVGFIHGVMNTDNVTLSGETIDYGPCAFMDAHDPRTVFSSIDRQGRYAYGNQPAIMGWNLSRLGGALLPLVGEEGIGAMQSILDGWEGSYRAAWTAVLRRKLGLATPQDGDRALLDDLRELMQAQHPDHTRTFRRLSDAARGEIGPWLALFDDSAPAQAWLDRWLARLDQEPDGRMVLAERMDRVNPLYIPRNHRVEEALAAAVDEGDLSPFEQLQSTLKRPFDAQDGVDHLEAPAGAAFTETYQTFCGT